MKSRDSALGWVALLVAAVCLAGCGGDDDGSTQTPDAATGPNHVANPAPAAGGGVSDGAISGELNVFVIDARTRLPVSGATVKVVGTTQTGTTDAAGLHTFKDDALAGAQTIAVSAEGHVPATWYGANGAVVTITVDPTKPAAAPDTATVSGMLTLPRPTSASHATVALVTYSYTKTLDAVENQIAQPPGPNPGDPSPNACIVSFIGSATCQWTLRTRTGPQSHYAIIVDLDTHGTASGSDDTFTLLGYAVRTGIDLTADQMVTNEQLTMIAASDLADLHVTFPASAPATLGTLTAIPVLQLGDERFLFPVPQITPASSSAKVPKLTGAFASGSWMLVAQAKSGAAADPQSTLFARGFDPSVALTLGDFPALPTLTAPSGGKYAFEQVAGASLHTAEIDDANGKPVWKAVVLDGTKELSIDQTPDPLPSGMLTFKIGAARVTGLDVHDFAIDEKIDALDALSTQVVKFQK
jgi:hypothetical protein